MTTLPFAAKIYEMNLQMEVIQKGFAASVKEWNTRWLNVAFALYLAGIRIYELHRLIL